MYMLCKYPAVQEKASREVREATNIETVSSCAEFVSSVTDEAIEKMNYVHAVLTETLRLYPALPVVRLILNFFSPLCLYKWSELKYIEYQYYH
jgi:cytochrome P450